MSKRGRLNRWRARNQHHIYPQKRFPQFRNEQWNQANVNVRQHDLYHMLFGDRTPREIIRFLMDNFWNGHVEPMEARYALRIQGRAG